MNHEDTCLTVVLPRVSYIPPLAGRSTLRKALGKVDKLWHPCEAILPQEYEYIAPGQDSNRCMYNLPPGYVDGHRCIHICSNRNPNAAIHVFDDMISLATCFQYVRSIWILNRMTPERNFSRALKRKKKLIIYLYPNVEEK